MLLFWGIYVDGKTFEKLEKLKLCYHAYKKQITDK
jgi:hypothetical protein